MRSQHIRATLLCSVGRHDVTTHNYNRTLVINVKDVNDHPPIIYKRFVNVNSYRNVSQSVSCGIDKLWTDCESHVNMIEYIALLYVNIRNCNFI